MVQLDPARHLFVYSERCFKEFISNDSHKKLKAEKIFYDSTSFGFWGSELYKHDLPLFDANGKMSKMIRGRNCIKHWELKADKLNKMGTGDQATYNLR
ncbi:MAG: hypothetical protein IH840_12085 [Candidatus Heimdallarchaeota archaeon]|nr:hypothetical protein [Candidatus Heimdallarchaeota archaeon]